MPRHTRGRRLVAEVVIGFHHRNRCANHIEPVPSLGLGFARQAGEICRKAVRARHLQRDLAVPIGCETRAAASSCRRRAACPITQCNDGPKDVVLARWGSLGLGHMLQSQYRQHCSGGGSGNHIRIPDFDVLMLQR